MKGSGVRVPAAALEPWGPRGTLQALTNPHASFIVGAQFLRTANLALCSVAASNMRRALSIPRAALVLVALLAAGGSGPPAAGAIRPVAHPVALGVTTHGVSSSSRHPGRALRRYAAHVGGMPRVVMWYQTWYAGPLVVRRVMDPVENHGAIPMITWMPLAAPSKAVSLAGIAAGKDDAYLKQSAADARAWGHRFL